MTDEKLAERFNEIKGARTIGGILNEKLVEALIDAQREIGHATKDSSNPYFKSSYASLESVIDTAKAALNKHGILFQQVVRENEDMSSVSVETILMGHGAEIKTGILTVPLVKIDPQAFGAALSYARRYSLSMATGIFQSDDDAESAMVRYIIKGASDSQKGKVLSEDTSIGDFVKSCKKFMGQPEEARCKALYDANKWVIKQAKDDADGEDRQSLETMISLYTEPTNIQKIIQTKEK